MEEVGAGHSLLDKKVRKDNGGRELIARDERMGSCRRFEALVLREVLLVEEGDAIVIDDNEEATSILPKNEFSPL